MFTNYIVYLLACSATPIPLFNPRSEHVPYHIPYLFPLELLPFDSPVPRADPPIEKNPSDHAHADRGHSSG